LGLELHVLNASTESELDAAFAKVIELRASGLVIGGDAFFTSNSKQLAALAVRYKVPAVYQWREFAAAGGLVSYGSNVTETHRLVGLYTGRILKGFYRVPRPKLWLTNLSPTTAGRDFAWPKASSLVGLFPECIVTRTVSIKACARHRRIQIGSSQQFGNFRLGI
jgi:hypothetical protein